MKLVSTQSQLSTACLRLQRSLRPVFAFSLVVNLLLLTSPLFMLQVYDRVLISGSQETLIFLLLLALFCLGLLGVLEWARNALMTRIANQFDHDLGTHVFDNTLTRAHTSQPVQDLNTVRNFVSAPFTLALFDAPWIPLFLGLVYLLHPLLGHISLVGALLLFGLAILNEKLTRSAVRDAGEALAQASRYTELTTRNREAVLGMGMSEALARIWRGKQSRGLTHLSRMADTNARISTLAKVIRQILQVAILAAGAWLTIEHITSAGVMIAASIITARALAPIEQAIQGWRSLSQAREALENLDTFLGKETATDSGVKLRRPRGAIWFENVQLVKEMPHRGGISQRKILQGIEFTLAPGRQLGIVGASGSGKTSLARLILGIHSCSEGHVRIDGAEMGPELREQFARFMGYLPQDIELLDGTVGENIARFCKQEDGAVDSNGVIEAARLAGAHELILQLPQGYDTLIGPAGMPLSGGQKQRIGLARALFGRPAILVLDEPTAHLDTDGQQQFMQLLKGLRHLKTTVVVISHQPSLLAEVDRILIMAQGKIERMGPADEILSHLIPGATNIRKPVKAARAAAGSKKRRLIVRQGSSIVPLRGE